MRVVAYGQSQLRTSTTIDKHLWVQEPKATPETSSNGYGDPCPSFQIDPGALVISISGRY